MPYLDAALAFALSMLGISLLIQNIINWILKPRKQAEIAQAIRHFADRELMQIFTQEQDKFAQKLGGKIDKNTQASLDKAKSLLADLKSQLSAKNESTPAVPQIADHHSGDVVQTTNIDGAAIVTVTTDEMIGLLKRSPFGQEVTKAIGTEADALFNSLAERFESARTLFRARIRKSARGWSMFIGTLVALALNINAFTLITVYISDPDARNAVIAQQETIAPADQDQLDKFCFESGFTPEQETKCLEDSKLTYEMLAAQTSTLSSTIPMGWDGTTFKEWIADAKKTICTEFLYWLLGCLLTGALAGLGSPFWYDVVKNVAGFRDRAKALAAQKPSQQAN